MVSSQRYFVRKSIPIHLTPVDVMEETRHEKSKFCDIIEISETVKRPDVKKDVKDRMAINPGNKGAIARLCLGRLS